MTWLAWLSLATICFMGAISPGPSLLVILRHTLHGGQTAGLVASWCHALGIGVYATLSVAGLGALQKNAPVIYHTLSIAGAGYLLFMAWGALTQGSHFHGQLDETNPKKGSLFRAARDALSISLLSPKILLFFIGLFSPFIGASEATLPLWLLVLTPLFIDGGWYSLVVFFFSRGPILSWMRQHARTLDRISGIFMFGIAATIITRTLYTVFS